ncbi:hypothetical protein SFOMI_1772 [Sphingobium fuliginis]|uniref:Uncharacterized protein n=1 Tax=Sphingobium fuliginis (strain ATCC 27551) TaxID=336203 RepID=A0A292ZEJ1_SPHSA|nr:hypothetical protein SFOMI_1772 [Sphingobium fuliginis]
MRRNGSGREGLHMRALLCTSRPPPNRKAAADLINFAFEYSL